MSSRSAHSIPKIHSHSSGEEEQERRRLYLQTGEGSPWGSLDQDKGSETAKSCCCLSPRVSELALGVVCPQQPLLQPTVGSSGNTRLPRTGHPHLSRLFRARHSLSR